MPPLCEGYDFLGGSRQASPFDFLNPLWLVFLIGLLFLAYWPFRFVVNELAKTSLSHRPIMLFMSAVVGGGFWFGSCGFFFYTLFNALFPLLILGLGGDLLGLTCFIIYACQNAHTPPLPKCPRGKFQIFTTDLVLGVFCYGVGLFAGSAILNYFRLGEYFPALAGYLACTSALALFISADLCRRDITGREPFSRTKLFLFNFVLFPVAWPLTLLAYYRCHRALARAAA